MKKLIFVLVLIFNLTFAIYNCSSQWYQQTLPGNYGGIYCLKFWNANTGWMSTGAFVDSINSSKILKTTNGGNNWFVVKESLRMYNFQVIDSLTIYGRAKNPYMGESIYRTFNGGAAWDSVSSTWDYVFAGLYFFNKDTGYVGASDGSWGYLLKTTNGGLTLNQIYRDDNPYFGFDLIFFKEKVNGENYGYCNSNLAGAFYKTTNSGNNWIRITNGLYNNVGAYFFMNKDTGWISNIHGGSVIQHTTDGGISWTDQYSTLFNNYYTGDIYFSSYNKGWAGASDGYLVYATTTGGQIWGKQIVPQSRAGGIFFLDSLRGWCYSWQISKTTNGGGVIIGITKDSSSNSIPQNYILKQNYPNPFNSITIIEYSIIKKATIGINIYDITGRSVYDMTANNQEPGNYKLKLDFNSLNLTSGIYFYKFLAVDGENQKLYSQTKKMIYIK
ncbi:MAG: T9SS type A sorting domain-containing protein [Ignavibacteria bacterium]